MLVEQPTARCTRMHSHTSLPQLAAVVGGGGGIGDEVACPPIVGNHDNPGLLQRFGKDFFDAASEVKPEERQMAVSFYEIYQEKAYDLLGDGRQALKVRGAEETYLGGLTEADVSSFNEFENLRRRAWAKRATASTALNRHSSLSHVIVRL
ncbi:unnamed protein product, partial [Toxocara canis]|uniref:Kinesin motor domain-containing protein n=1 Tax=Toxocara canis TaxID=6265 RepID=A0A183VHL9_TOXCA